MKWLNHPLLIDTKLTRDDADEWYFEAVDEVAKLRKEFEIESPGKFVYAEWQNWEKEVDNFLSIKSNLRGIPLAYVIRKDDAPLTIMFYDFKYDM